MTTKILTVRVPATLYSSLCREAGELGVSVSAYARRVIERESDAQQLDDVRRELLARLDALAAPAAQPDPQSPELLLLCRAIAAHLNPQLVTQVRARLSQPQ